MRKISKSINYIFIFFLCVIVMVKCAYLFELLSISFALIGSVAIVTIGIFIFGKKEALDEKIYIFEKKYLERMSYKKMVIVLICLSIGLKLLAIFIFRISSIASHPDIQVYVTTAKELATKGIALTYANYCYTYSHMFWYAIFLSPVVKVFGDSQFVLSVFTAIVSTATILAITDTVAYQFSKVKAIIVGSVLCLLPSQILLNQYITHEHALLFFLAISVWLYFRVLPEQQSYISKIIVNVCCILSLFAAYMMNTAGLVMIIAFIILIIINMLKEVSLKNVVVAISKCMVVFIVVILGTTLCAEFQFKSSKITNDYIKGDKVLWTLYVGSNADTSAHWSVEDTESFSAFPEDSNSKEIQQFRKEVLIKRYKELIEEPGKLVNLLKDKLVTIWSCFTYSIMYTNETIPKGFIQIIYNRFVARPLVLIEYGLSVFAVFWGLTSNIQRHMFKNELYVLVELFLMGSTAMLLLTECNNKYTLAMQPFFWLACIVVNSEKKVKE